MKNEKGEGSLPDMATTATKKTTKKAPVKKAPKEPVAAVTTEPEKEKEKKKHIRHPYLYAVGRRKNATARTRLFKGGQGNITVNEKDYTAYFPTFPLQQIIKQPLEAVGKLTDFDFSIKVQGGGVHGQAEAARHGITRALVVFDENLKPILKPFGYLTRDPRKKERKKPGLKRARRAPQFSKR